MYLEALNHQGVRNLEPGQVKLGKGLNIFYGNNGAGKSSILEAIAFATSGRSFRTTKLELVVSEEQQETIVFAVTNNNKKIGIGFQKKNKQKTIKINGEKVNTLSLLTRVYPTQVLSPEAYHLIDSGPSERRKYLDWCLFHVEHTYHSNWKTYASILKQRNALLRIGSYPDIEGQIAGWDQQLCEVAKVINSHRAKILSELEALLTSIINQIGIKIFKGLRLSYYPGYTGELYEKLKDSLKSDCDSGFTKFGPHKADVRIKVNGYLAKDYLSRGQKKVLINALFLAQTLLLKSKTSKDSLFIIDDFSSELDEFNQKALLSMLLSQENVQIVLSCLQRDSLKWLEKGYNSAHMFHVEHGEITPIIREENNSF